MEVKGKRKGTFCTQTPSVPITVPFLHTVECKDFTNSLETNVKRGKVEGSSQRAKKMLLDLLPCFGLT